MARLPRYFIPGCPQHIVLRGNNRQALFAAGAETSSSETIILKSTTQCP
jgi:REP element-mobilizing transposase RayT